MYARLGILALCCAVAFWLGDRIASGRYEARIADISAAIAEAQVEVVERHNLALEAERKRSNEAQNKRTQQHSLAQEVIHEVAADTDRSCEWREPHRLRIERLYGSYGYSPSGSAGVSNTLSSSAINSNAERGVGSSGIHLGGGLQGPAR